MSRPSRQRFGEIRAHGIAGCRVFALPEGIWNKATFFGAVREALPLDPPLGTRHNWDAIADCIWGGIDALGEGSVVILWPGSDGMARLSPSDFQIAIDILDEVSKSLGDVSATVGDPTDLAVLLG